MARYWGCLRAKLVLRLSNNIFCASIDADNDGTPDASGKLLTPSTSPPRHQQYEEMSIDICRGVSDGCPNDANKIAPGVCGCGVADDDTDNDGVEDCNGKFFNATIRLTLVLLITAADNCPNDGNKTDPGVCGCGVEDVDTDSDGVLDCNGGEFPQTATAQPVPLPFCCRRRLSQRS